MELAPDEKSKAGDDTTHNTESTEQDSHEVEPKDRAEISTEQFPFFSPSYTVAEKPVEIERKMVLDALDEECTGISNVFKRDIMTNEKMSLRKRVLLV